MIIATQVKSEVRPSSITVPKLLKDSYLPSLDGLRAISVLMVTIAHLGLPYKTYDHYLHPIAKLGVQFFFVISGFLITTLLMKEKITHGTISLKRFYVRRFFRIIPVAYLYLVFIIALNAVLHLKMDYYYIFLSFLFLRNFSMNSRGFNNLTTHYWSLSVEEQFYLIFPVILKKNLNYFTLFLILMTLSPIVIDFYNLYDTTPNAQTITTKILIQFFSQFQAISIGALCAIFLFKNSVDTSAFIPKTTLITLVFFATIVLLLFLRNDMFSVNNMLMSFLFAAILILNIQKSSAKSFKLLNNRYMKFIGILSYSMYIWQPPLAHSLTFIRKLPFFQAYKNEPLAYILIGVGSAIAIVVAGYISYYFYEKPFLKLKDRFK